VKILQFIISFSIALVIYFCINYLIYIHGLKAFSISPLTRRIYIIAFITFASSYFLGRILERISIGPILNFLIRTGVVVCIVLIAGRINALNPHIRQLNIQINKKIEGAPKVTIALISDIHLGALVGPKHLRKMITLI
jgi:hypothetical protein